MRRVKYPRTFHVPWSPGATSDDKTHPEVDSLFAGRQVVVTEKLDGENTTIYSDGFVHARSLDSRNHVSRNWVKALAARLVGHLPPGWRVCGENVYATHSIAYTNLPSYFLVFSIWDDTDTCLSWEDTLTWCWLLGLHPVPVLYAGVYDEVAVKACFRASAFGESSEGYVIRRADAFAFEDFSLSVAKFVRAHHVQTDEHWMYQEVRPNRLAEERT